MVDNPTENPDDDNPMLPDEDEENEGDPEGTDDNERRGRDESKIPLSVFNIEELRGQHEAKCLFMDDEGNFEFLREVARRGTEGLTREERKRLKNIKDNEKDLRALEGELKRRGEKTDSLVSNREMVTTKKAERRSLQEKIDTGEITYEGIAEGGTYKSLIQSLDKIIEGGEVARDFYTTKGFFGKVRDFNVSMKRAGSLEILTDLRGELVSNEAVYIEKKMNLEALLDRYDPETEGSEEMRVHIKSELKIIEEQHKLEMIYVLQKIVATGMVDASGFISDLELNTPNIEEVTESNQEIEEEEGGEYAEKNRKKIEKLEARIMLFQREINKKGTDILRKRYLTGQINETRVLIKKYEDMSALGVEASKASSHVNNWAKGKFKSWVGK